MTVSVGWTRILKNVLNDILGQRAGLLLKLGRVLIEYQISNIFMEKDYAKNGYWN